MDSAGAYAALITAVAGLVAILVYVVKTYVNKPEDFRVQELQKDLDKSRGDVEYLTKRNKELETNLADASHVLLDFPKLKEQVSQLQKEVEDLRPRVMEYENLTKKYVELQNSYADLKIKNEKLEIQVKTYEDILVKAVAKSGVLEDGTSINKNADPAGQSSDCP